MLDHVSLGITDIDRSRRFYDAVLRPLGLVRIVDFGEGRGSDYGAAAGSVGVEFTITHEIDVRTPIPGAHVCFRAPDRAAVDAFHAAALGFYKQKSRIYAGFYAFTNCAAAFYAATDNSALSRCTVPLPRPTSLAVLRTPVPLTNSARAAHRPRPSWG